MDSATSDDRESLAAIDLSGQDVFDAIAGPDPCACGRTCLVSVARDLYRSSGSGGFTLAAFVAHAETMGYRVKRARISGLMTVYPFSTPDTGVETTAVVYGVADDEPAEVPAVKAGETIAEVPAVKAGETIAEVRVVKASETIAEVPMVPPPAVKASETIAKVSADPSSVRVVKASETIAASVEEKVGGGATPTLLDRLGRAIDQIGAECEECHCPTCDALGEGDEVDLSDDEVDYIIEQCLAAGDLQRAIRIVRGVFGMERRGCIENALFKIRGRVHRSVADDGLQVVTSVTSVTRAVTPVAGAEALTASDAPAAGEEKVGARDPPSVPPAAEEEVLPTSDAPAAAPIVAAMRNAIEVREGNTGGVVRDMIFYSLNRANVAIEDVRPCDCGRDCAVNILYDAHTALASDGDASPEILTRLASIGYHTFVPAQLPGRFKARPQ